MEKTDAADGTRQEAGRTPEHPARRGICGMVGRLRRALSELFPREPLTFAERSLANQEHMRHMPPIA